MKIILKIEYIAFFIMGILMFSQTGFSWWWFLGLFFTPDVLMLGYVINTKVGAFCYNLFHHFGIAILVYFSGLYFKHSYTELAGSVLFAHSAFDRILGYGLKYGDNFKNTHLGRIGK